MRAVWLGASKGETSILPLGSDYAVLPRFGVPMVKLGKFTYILASCRQRSRQVAGRFSSTSLLAVQETHTPAGANTSCWSLLSISQVGAGTEILRAAQKLTEKEAVFDNWRFFYNYRGRLCDQRFAKLYHVPSTPRSTT